MMFGMNLMVMQSLEDQPAGLQRDKASRERYLLRVSRAVMDAAAWNPV